VVEFLLPLARCAQPPNWVLDKSFDVAARKSRAILLAVGRQLQDSEEILSLELVYTAIEKSQKSTPGASPFFTASRRECSPRKDRQIRNVAKQAEELAQFPDTASRNLGHALRPSLAATESRLRSHHPF
jgi:hypothetical protein